jgi:hypothetical protein
MTKKIYEQPEDSQMKVQEPYRRAVLRTGLNKAQLHFLRILNYVRTDEELEELEKIVRDFYIRKAQTEADCLWDEGKLGDFLLNEHLRTPYK